MQHTARGVVMQFAHLLQQDLFPPLAAALGPLSPQMQLLASVVSLIPLAGPLWARRASTGRPAKDRVALATAFLAKAILNLPTTRDLIGRLHVDEPLRRLCGWNSAQAVPHESKFSRAFAEFAATQLPQQLHAAIVAATQSERLVGHIARDSTAIAAREHVSETKQQRKKREAEKSAGRAKSARRQAKSASRQLSQERAKASERGTRIERQRHQKLEQMVADLPRGCDSGGKKNSRGETQYWRGYKLHLDVADGQVPISAILTSASVHDSQVAIPLMRLSSQRVVYLYDLMDSAYDAAAILAESGALNHVPIVAPHPRRGTKSPSQCPKIYPDQPTPELSWAQPGALPTKQGPWWSG